MTMRNGKTKLPILGVLLLPLVLGASAPVDAPTVDANMTENVRRSAQELLRADAAAIVDDPKTRPVAPKPAKEEPVVVRNTIKTPQTQPAATRPAATRPATNPAVAQNKTPQTQPVDPAIEKLRQTKLDNPLAAADSFFKAGRLLEAAILYDQALRNPKHEGDKDWILLQLASCKEQTEPNEAIDLYKKLLNDCPNSTWRRVAQARQNVLQWLLAQDVQGVLTTQPAGKTE